jgi:hypothetical protein
MRLSGTAGPRLRLAQVLASRWPASPGHQSRFRPSRTTVNWAAVTTFGPSALEVNIIPFPITIQFKLVQTSKIHINSNICPKFIKTILLVF